MIDPSVKGKELGSVRFPVERSKLAELARSFHDDDPIWYDPEAARAAGLGEIPMPPTVTVLADHWHRDGALAAALAIGADLERLLHGEVGWDYLRPLRAGDELTATARVADVTTREGIRGGRMTMVTIETHYIDGHGELAARRTDVLIETAGRS